MARGVWVSPWTARRIDYLGRAVTVSVTHNNTTPFAITNPGLTGFREAGCLFDRVVIGRVSNGTRRVVMIPEGAFDLTRQQLINAGFTNITDIVNNGFTVGMSETPT